MNINVSIAVNELISALSLAMDYVDTGHRYHGWRAAFLTSAIGGKCDYPWTRELFYAAMIHDIGGTCVPQHLIHDYAQPLDAICSDVQNHPIQSARIIQSIPGLNHISDDVLQHHERWNGSGYPDGLAGDDLTRGGQILALADFLDIRMRQNRNVKQSDFVQTLVDYKEWFAPRVITLAQTTIADFHPTIWNGILSLNDMEDIFSMTKDLVGPICIPSDIDAMDMVLEVLAQSIDAKHHYTHGHSRRVSHYSVAIGRAMGLSEEYLQTLNWASLLHDIGKICIPGNILDKRSGLTDQEYHHIKHHASYTFDIISRITDLRYIAPIAAGHHERYDGRGYPLGLQAEEIPLGARIMCVADTFDALTSHRPYQRELGLDEICNIFRKNAGTQFDARIVRAGLNELLNIYVDSKSMINPGLN